jgi:hypothetical protein
MSRQRTKATEDDSCSTKGDRTMKKLMQKIFGHSAARGRQTSCDIVDATCHAEVGMMTRIFGDAGTQIALNR